MELKADDWRWRNVWRQPSRLRVKMRDSHQNSSWYSLKSKRNYASLVFAWDRGCKFIKFSAVYSRMNRLGIWGPKFFWRGSAYGMPSQ